VLTKPQPTNVTALQNTAQNPGTATDRSTTDVTGLEWIDLAQDRDKRRPQILTFSLLSEEPVAL
jgi:hypothetical protein